MRLPILAHAIAIDAATLYKGFCTKVVYDKLHRGIVTEALRRQRVVPTAHGIAKVSSRVYKIAETTLDHTPRHYETSQSPFSPGSVTREVVSVGNGTLTIMSVPRHVLFEAPQQYVTVTSLQAVRMVALEEDPPDCLPIADVRPAPRQKSQAPYLFVYADARLFQALSARMPRTGSPEGYA
ncbi:hypothetical protein CCHR01_15953 [Colletotrichum chrysophilum]|uniref:Uncharacterized protein n=1 Tax=Colletotrichum chrysophilum TaxID=1836956 RepID=A0AAD9A6R1_9PEZI|nr:hypothetical protein CCHR01_15953 [Colletotrichum chrysophilum]